MSITLLPWLRRLSVCLAIIVLPATLLAEDLDVQSTGPLRAIGDFGGPFSPSGQTFMLKSTGPIQIRWSVAGPSWITLKSPQGLDYGYANAGEAATTVTASINASANALPYGTYDDTIVFTNLSTGVLLPPRPVTLSVSPQQTALIFPLDLEPGWTRSGEWAFGHPTGGGGTSFGFPDPSNGATGTNVFGINLNGDYATTAAPAAYLTAGPFNLFNYGNVRLQYQRWLNVDGSPSGGIAASIEVSRDGATWTRVWNPTSPITDKAWIKMQHDISALADHQPVVYIRWVHQAYAGVRPYSGWNIDDVELLGQPTGPPQFRVESIPAGRTLTVDGASYVAPHIFSWVPGTSHTIESSALQDSGTGVRHIFTSWSDAGALAHSVTASVYTAYTAYFNTQYFLTTGAGAGGTGRPATGWYDAGETVAIATSVNAGFTFAGWSGSGPGSYSGFDNPAMVTMSGPITEMPNFGVGADPAFVVGTAPGTLRNEYSGWVGMQIAVGANPLTVLQLGRIVAPGNSGTHQMKLIRASDGTDVPNGSAAVATSGGSVGQFRYGILSSPVTLAAGTTYWVMSQETAGGDSWYDWNTSVTTTGVAAAVGLAWGVGSPNSWATYGVANQSFVPLNFKYAVANPQPPPTPFVAGTVLGTLRNNFSGWVGMQVTIGANALIVGELGRIVVPGNSRNHIVKLVKASDGLDVPGGAVTVSPNGGTPGQFRYGTLASPVKLAAGTTYFLVSGEWSGGDTWYDSNTTLTTTGAATAVGLAWNSNGTSWVTAAAANQAFGPVNFTYTVATTSEHVLTVTSFNPGSGVSIAVSPTDNGGQANGVTAFPRTYNNNAVVTLTAPGTAGGKPFQKWQMDGVNWSTTLSTTVTMDANHTLTAVYGPDTAYVTATVPGTLRNNFSGWVGMQIQVGANPIAVSHLGRIMAPGNSGTHTVMLRRVASPLVLDVVGGSAVVTMSGGSAGAFQYGALSSPVILAPGTTYFVITQETAGGDSWYDSNTTVTTTDVAVENGVISGPDLFTYSISPVANRSFGPVNFKYTSATVPYVTKTALGTLRNDYNGWAGMQIAVGTKPMIVYELGRMMAPFNAGTHVVKLVKASDGSDVPGGSVAVGMSGGMAGQFQYGTLASPVTLAAGSSYFILSQETSLGDSWYDWNTTMTTTPAAAANGLAWWGPNGWITYPVANQSFGPVNLKYVDVDTAFVTVKTRPGNGRADYDGWVGMQFTVGASPLTVSELGRYGSFTGTLTHTVKLVKASDGLDVPGASVNVALPGLALLYDFAYKTLDSPVTLAAGTTYWLLSKEVQGTDGWYDWSTTLTTTAAATINAIVWGKGPGGWSVYPVTNQSFGPLNFRYQIP